MKYLIYLLVMLLITGCAMITKGPIQEVEFTSNTDSVTVYVNDKDIGKTPTTIKLWKFKKNTAEFFLPDGQEHAHLLKTHMNNGMLNNGLLVLVDPILGALGFGVDWVVGSGRSFDEKTLRFEHLKTGKTITLDIRAKIYAPENYSLLFIGGGLLLISEDEDNEYPEKQILIPELTLETMRSFRDMYHLGVGFNLHYIDRYRAEEEKVLNNVFQLGAYAVFKYSPLVILENLRPYIIGELGTGISWGKDNDKSTANMTIIYIGTGWGIDYKEKFYFEMTSQGRFFDFIWGEGIGLENIRFMLRVGYRLNL